MSEEMLTLLTVEGNNTRWLSPQKMSVVIATLLVIALAGPTWKQQPSPFTQNNAALVIALDVSDSMLQQDIQPSRLLRAKQKILQLLKERGDTHTALLAFAGSAHTVMPLTNDREMIRHFLDVLAPNIMPVDGKIPQNVLPIADKLMSSTGVPGTLLLISDGATTESTKQFSEYFSNHPHQLLVWGIGQEEPINTEVIPLQRNNLLTLARESDGRYIDMTQDSDDAIKVNRYVENNLVIVEDESRPWLDAGYFLVFIIALLYLFWFRKGWTLKW